MAASSSADSIIWMRSAEHAVGRQNAQPDATWEERKREGEHEFGAAVCVVIDLQRLPCARHSGFDHEAPVCTEPLKKATVTPTLKDFRSWEDTHAASLHYRNDPAWPPR
jgi:hypothetical protein